MKSIRAMPHARRVQPREINRRVARELQQVSHLSSGAELAAIRFSWSLYESPR
jgi:hypothetical protein